MAADLQTLRTIAQALPGVEEAPCHGTAAFYVAGKLLGRMQEDEETISMACRKEERDALIAQHSDVFSVTSHFFAYDYVLVDLTAVSSALLARTMEAAWKMKARKKDLAAYDPAKLPYWR